MIINDLLNPFSGKVRGNAIVTQYAQHFIALALLELSQNIEFEELKVTGPLANFVTNIAEYPLQGYDPNGIQGNPFVAATDHRITFINNWFIYFDTSGIITPGVSTGTNINKRDLRVVEPMSKVSGIPSVYTLQGANKNKGVVMVGQMPDHPYATQMRYQRQHPFNVKPGEVQEARLDTITCQRLGQSEIYMPDDWIATIVLLAAYQACDDIGMNDIGQIYHQELFGYKDKRGNELPGIIQVKKTQQQRQSEFNSRALRPVVRRYT